ncbi:MAG TPA: type I methionyl aminopeptidase [Thermodesulfobacteriota bacterium]|nr:type I methionyl aminopeptidase [Deltaproteobacteria bacterium]HNR12024.1 type I methionyl aminopeptidase [Thermodesulfobacteriota bacterium]HNU70732.1 type I methionyl aminopeptidase [Thermodesulfobacteriota bacterium]HQO76882.1 type I methionyl aminopeptidase [Thermodesulfobacteriota bacterium]
MIVCRSAEEIEKLKKSNRIVALILNELREAAKPGVSVKELDQLSERLIEQYHCIPAFKGYRNYPACLCASVNEQIVHGIPDGRKLKNGDIISLDIGVNLDGYFGDAAITVPVGTIDAESATLLRVTEDALYKGIAQARVGNRLSDISHAIQTWVEKHGFSVVRDFVGHGIGKQLHEEPQVPNFGKPGFGPRLREGMTLCLEPMVNVGTYKVKVLDDGWTAVTADGSRSAHFEHSIVITKGEPLILSTLD